MMQYFILTVTVLSCLVCYGNCQDINDPCAAVKCAKPDCKNPVYKKKGGCCGICPGELSACLKPKDPSNDCDDECSSHKECQETKQKCCHNGGCFVCTKPDKLNGKSSCKVEGRKNIKDGETTTDDCNTCTCFNGDLWCTKRACYSTCEYDGNTYSEGETMPADNTCSTCTCSGGRRVCATYACAVCDKDQPSEDECCPCP